MPNLFNLEKKDPIRIDDLQCFRREGRTRQKQVTCVPHCYMPQWHMSTTHTSFRVDTRKYNVVKAWAQASNTGVNAVARMLIEALGDILIQEPSLITEVAESVHHMLLEERLIERPSVVTQDDDPINPSVPRRKSLKEGLAAKKGNPYGV
jgi:hypothetical protein